MQTLRVPIVRVDLDGTVTDGTALWEESSGDGFRVSDFRDLNGEPLDLPPGSAFELTTI